MNALKKIFIVLGIGLICFSYTTNAQQGNIWYFGEGAGLNFNVTPPQPLTNGILNTNEGCASICNKTGSLLFYTDGITVYNKNHQAMPNGTGLLGNSSSTQSAIIIPNPGDTNLYYIFTADCVENSFVNGYNYSLVDMRLDGGLGNITVQKNINLSSSSTERLTAVKAANGIDYWVITKGINNNRFMVYKVDCNGINPNPVISDVGVSHIFDPSQYSGAGAIKASPDGKKICVAIAWPVAMAELFDFDNTTGKLSNPVDLTGYTSGYIFIYGIEFSPNSKLLYVSTSLNQTINQYDISSGSTATINASKFVINTSPFYPAALQLSPDKRIFVASNLTPSVSVINNPDVYGAGCNLSLGSINLAGRLCKAGLPAYIASFFDVTNHIDFTHSFVDCHVQFNGTTDLSGNLSWNWDFGDGTFGSGQTISHSFKKVGTYNITLTVKSTASACGLPLTDSFTITKPITINNVFAVDYDYAGNCVNQPTQFSDSTVLTIGNITSRTWYFGDGSPTSNALNPVHTYASVGIYNVKLLISTSGVCNADSIIKQVHIETMPSTVFLPTNGCINQAVQFTDNSTNPVSGVGQWKWFFGDGDSSVLQNPVHTYLNYGNYTAQLQVASPHGCKAAAITQPIVIDSKPVAAFDYQYPCLDKPTVFSNSSSNAFGSMIYNWQFGDNSSAAITNPSHQYTIANNYTAQLTVSTANGCSTSVTKPVIVVATFANAGRDTIALYDQHFQLNGSGGGSYLWSAATNLSSAIIANPVARLKKDETFTLQTTNADGCVATDIVVIKVVTNFDVFVPTAFTPNGDGINDILKPLPIGIDHLNYFKVYNRYGQEVFTTKELGKGWNGKISGALQPQGAFVWIVQAVDIFGKVITKKGTTLLIP
ncbi:PKD domain-containing protein [Ferruginibacter sp.]|nr:PKD domain-containing protein [Ferruginibacter sp.]